MARTFNSPEDREHWEESVRAKLIDLEQKTISSGNRYYVMKPEVALRVVDAKLSPTAYRVWLYLCTLFPFSGINEMPTQEELAVRLNVSRRAILRAAAELEDVELWVFKIERWKGQNLTGFRGDKNVTPTDKNVTPADKNVTPADKNVTLSFSETAQGASFKNPKCTNRSNKEFKRTIGTPTVAPASLDSDGLGTKLDPSNPYAEELRGLLMLATQAGIKTNGTISRTIAALRLQRSAADARQAVENSVSAVVEQVSRGKCKNSGAMLNASLQRELNGQGFTANEAKRDARGRKEEPMLNEVALGVGKALERQDRAWALGRLQQLWDDGYHNLLEEMLHLFKREWQFSLTSEGVRDADET